LSTFLQQKVSVYLLYITLAISHIITIPGSSSSWLDIRPFFTTQFRFRIQPTRRMAPVILTGYFTYRYLHNSIRLWMS